MYASEHVFFLSDGLANDMEERRFINAFQELRKTGNPVTLPARQQSFRDQLRMTWGAFRGLVIYEFVTISKEIDQQDRSLRININEPIGNWC